jgi:hypothetical protein
MARDARNAEDEPLAKGFSDEKLERNDELRKTVG